MISLFAGEFLLHPAPIEYSGRTCSHNCCYCFANIRNKNIQAKFAATLGFFERINSGDSLEKTLFRKGFPLCISNRTDPLGDSNVDDTMILADMMASVSNGVFWQTKGGKRQYELLDKLVKSGKKNQWIYITITCAKDDKSRIVEPNAPPTSERLEFAAECAKRGLGVSVAFNPLVESWCSEEECLAIIAQCKGFGVNSFVFQALHLNSREIDTFEDWRLKSFDGLDFQKEFEDNRHRLFARKIVGDLQSDKDINVFMQGMPYATKWHEQIREKLGKAFPSNYDFINSAVRSPKDSYSFEDYYASITSHSGLAEFFEEPRKNLSAYIFTNARHLWRGNVQYQNIFSYKDLIRIIWNQPKFNMNPQASSVFSNYTRDTDSDGNIILTRKEVIK